MPTFEQYVLSAPYGFPNACLALNKILIDNEEDNSIIEDIVTESWNNIVNKTDDNTYNSPQYYNEKKAIIYIIKSMKQSLPTPSISNAANILAGNSFLSKETIEKILIKIKELSSTENNNEVKQILKSSGKLTNFQWKIGVAIASNSCKSIFQPYVSIRFDLKNEEGVLVPHTAELSYEQFKEVQAAFTKVSKVMDSV